MDYFNPPPHTRIKDYRGVVSGMLTVLGFAGITTDGKAKFWCKCECGNIKPVRSILIKRKSAQSCGCKAVDMLVTRSTKHGHTVNGKCSPTYWSWSAMHKRCRDKNNKDYGGRGISVCERWASFDVFLADMGERPANKTLDRGDTNGNYSPSNCKWSTRKTQQRNRTNTAMAVFEGKIMPIAEVGDRLGISYGAALQRMNNGKIERVA